jgi:hypothetical protein
MTGRRPTDPIFKDGVGIVDFGTATFHIKDVIPLIEECNGISQENMA